MVCTPVMSGLWSAGGRNKMNSWLYRELKVKCIKLCLKGRTNERERRRERGVLVL